MAGNIEIERRLVAGFVLPPRRSRYFALLESRGGREKLRRSLAHFSHWDPRYIRPLQSHEPTAIKELLLRAGAPPKCYVFSEDDRYDGKEMNLDEAVTTCVGNGMGTVLSCVAGQLAFYEAEGPGERYILKRESAPQAYSSVGAST